MWVYSVECAHSFACRVNLLKKKSKQTVRIQTKHFHLQDSLIRQSLECNLIAYLLNLLNSRMEYADNPSMVSSDPRNNHFHFAFKIRPPFPSSFYQQIKAQIVSALKAMTHNLNFGDQVSHILNSNPIWAEYRDQKHDLFITDTNVRGYLTGKFSGWCWSHRVRIRTNFCLYL